jgi:hypothetical protein
LTCILQSDVCFNRINNKRTILPINYGYTLEREKCFYIHILPYGLKIWALYDEISRKYRRKTRSERIGSRKKLWTI